MKLEAFTKAMLWTYHVIERKRRDAREGPRNETKLSEESDHAMGRARVAKRSEGGAAERGHPNRLANSSSKITWGWNRPP
jgi:hypothetical protein